MDGCSEWTGARFFLAASCMAEESATQSDPSNLSSSFQFSRLQKYSNHQIVSFLERIGAEFGACQVRLWRSGGGVGGLPGAHRGGVQGVPGAHRGGFWGVTGASGWSLGRDRCIGVEFGA